MKKIIISLIVFVFFIGNIYANADENKCGYGDGKGTVSSMLNKCMNDTSVVAVKDDADIEGGFKKKVQGWTNNIALFLGLLSIGAIIYGGLMMTLSTGEDEKIKKAKDIVKWALIGLLGVILATTIVTLVINVMYGFGEASVRK